MNEMIVAQQTSMMPAITINEAINRYNAIVEFTKAVMKEDKDYGKIPGTTKPTLLKPGAEKLCNLFGLYPDFGEPIDKIVDFNAGLFYFQYRCVLYKDGAKVGSGNGSCNSRETKYRYRWVNTSKKPDKAEAEDLKAEGIGRWHKSKNSWIWQERVENNEPFELVNTIDKMAQKRAFIAATLVAVNASEFFTQDVEDLDIIEAQFEDEPETKKPEPMAQPEPEPESNGSDIYQAVVDAGYSENVHAAKNALVHYCRTGYDTEEKALAWMKAYRAWRDLDNAPPEAAEKANLKELPK